MATTSDTDVESLENEIRQLILNDQIQVRIDSQSKILNAKYTGPRTMTIEESIQFYHEFRAAHRPI